MKARALAAGQPSAAPGASPSEPPRAEPREGLASTPGGPSSSGESPSSSSSSSNGATLSSPATAMRRRISSSSVLTVRPDPPRPAEPPLASAPLGAARGWGVAESGVALEAASEAKLQSRTRAASGRAGTGLEAFRCTSERVVTGDGGAHAPPPAAGLSRPPFPAQAVRTRPAFGASCTGSVSGLSPDDVAASMRFDELLE
mmetsp:Transcript_2746/g.11093  ORF Transcript_2746/g.11093 Transcript_2746/m.11093 type:complete len:201 (-) Transcript_2746:125-727(-)